MDQRHDIPMSDHFRWLIDLHSGLVWVLDNPPVVDVLEAVAGHLLLVRTAASVFLVLDRVQGLVRMQPAGLTTRTGHAADGDLRTVGNVERLAQSNRSYSTLEENKTNKCRNFIKKKRRKANLSKIFLKKGKKEKASMKKVNKTRYISSKWKLTRRIFKKINRSKLIKFHSTAWIPLIVGYIIKVIRHESMQKRQKMLIKVSFNENKSHGNKYQMSNVWQCHKIQYEKQDGIRQHQ